MTVIYLLILGLCLLALYHLRRGAIYLPIHKEALDAMIQLAQLKPGMKVVDLGSGDGRVVVAFARLGADVVGFEVNPVLIWISRHRIGKQKLNQSAKIVSQSFWTADLSKFDVVVVFGVSHIMERLETKLKKELKPGTLVVSNIFRFPNLNLQQSKNGVLMYKI